MCATLLLGAFAGALATLVACTPPEPAPRMPEGSVSADAGTPPTEPPPTAPSEPAEGPLVVFLGDSLTAGYGLQEEEAFPSVLERLLAERGHPIRLVNAGVSGDTTAGGRSRLDWLLRQEPDILVLELGANDGLRGLPLDHTESNLRQIITRARRAGSRVLLLGMRVPPNYGADYAEGFAAIFPRLAEEMSVPLVEFLLDGVGGRPELNLADGIHPTAQGHRILAENVLPPLERMVEEESEPPRRQGGGTTGGLW